MNDNPEIRAKVLEWQRRHNIQDNDPALALIDLLDVYYRQPVIMQPAGDGKGAPTINPEAIVDAVRSSLQPSLDRVVTQIRDLERERPSSPNFQPEALTDSLRASLQPALDRVVTQLRDLERDRPSLAPIPTEILSESVRASIQPSLDRLATQIADAPKPTVVPISSEVLSEAIKTSLLPSLDRVTFQIQELQRRLETTNMEESAKKIESFHDNIDYCTKKLDVVKKEADSLVVKLEKASADIKPITRGAVVMLMLVSAVVGYVLAVILR